MRPEHHEQQASAFTQWHSKRGGSWEDSFSAWADSKDFSPRDRLAIRTIIADIMTSTTAVVTDPFAFLRDGAA